MSIEIIFRGYVFESARTSHLFDVDEVVADEHNVVASAAAYPSVKYPSNDRTRNDCLRYHASHGV